MAQNQNQNQDAAAVLQTAQQHITVCHEAQVSERAISSHQLQACKRLIVNILALAAEDDDPAQSAAYRGMALKLQHATDAAAEITVELCPLCRISCHDGMCSTCTLHGNRDDDMSSDGEQDDADSVVSTDENQHGESTVCWAWRIACLSLASHNFSNWDSSEPSDFYIADDARQRAPFIHISALADITNEAHPVLPCLRSPTPWRSQEAIKPGHGGNKDDSAEYNDSGEQHIASQEISKSFLRKLFWFIH